MRKLVYLLFLLLLMASLTGCEKNALSDNWSDLEFKINGIKYSLPTYFESFNANGWELDENDEITPGPVHKTYYLYHKDFYDDDRNVYVPLKVFFENKSSVTKNLKDCSIHYVILSTIYEGKKLKNNYEIELAKGIKWGSTAQEIKNAYGLEDLRESSNYGITTLNYSKNYNGARFIMFLYISDLSGLFEVTIGILE